MSKIVDREGLKAFRERLDEKYVIEGEYSPQTSVGLADNLTPYSEDSGTEQDNPFISNGTGTNNNQEIVTVGDYGLLKSKNGNTICVNQLFDYLSVASGSSDGITFTNNNDGSFTLNGTASATATYNLITNGNTPIFPVGHKILVLGQTGQSSCYIQGYSSATSTFLSYSQSIFEMPNTGTSGNFVRFRVESGTTLTNLKITPKFIDLTQWFNGNVPQDLLDNPTHWSWYYNGSLAYNTGTLVNANGVKLVSTGRQLWDEEWEEGAYSSVTGAKTSWVGAIRSSNKQRALPNTAYYLKFPTTELYIYWYDKNENFIGYDYKTSSNRIVTSPSNAYYFTFCTNNTYGSSYNNDITISLYYSPEQGGEGYDKYYRYETPYEVDTGNEVLRSAGSVCDIKVPSGEITRNLANHIFSNNDNIAMNTSTSFYITNASLSTAPIHTGAENYNVICDFVFARLFINESGVIRFNTTKEYESGNALKADLIGKSLNYQIDPTTEQGTPFAENLPINDYGMLYWDSDIPQGNTIFFPINYKGFLDDMYSRVEGDSSAYVVDTELQASETQRDTIDTQIKNAIGGTLRQLLASSQSIDFLNTDVVDLSTLTWIYTTSGNYFYADITGVANNGKCLSTKYQTNLTATGISQVNNNELKIFSTTLAIKDSSYTDATTFKNAMKGVLLAYEKA